MTLQYEVANPQKGQNIHYFCIKNNKHTLSYQRFTQAQGDTYK